MPVSKAQMRATAKYEKENYDAIRVRVPKGIRDKLKAYAANNGTTVNRLINDYINTLNLGMDGTIEK